MVFLVEFDKVLYFRCFEGILGGMLMIFGVVGMGENGVKWSFCRTHYRTRKWGFRRENIRYAIPGSRLFALKCKLRPYYFMKTYYNSTVLWYVFIMSSKNTLLTLIIFQFAIL